MIAPEIQELLNFLEQAPTSWHAVEIISKKLKEAGFHELNERDSWTLIPGQGYFVPRNGSSLCAFILPKHTPKQAVILAAHTDSPALKLKPHAEFRIQNMILWGVEVYGEPLLSSWLNRDLGLAGRLVYANDEGNLKSSLVCLKETPAIIPQLAVHLDREVNEKGLILNRQEHLAALATLVGDLPSDQSYLHQLIQKAADGKTVLSSELFLFPLDKPACIGGHQELLSSYRLDNLESTHAALHALCTSKQPGDDHLKMAIFWDNEEIGSRTAQGADSAFLNDTLQRMCCSLGLAEEELFKLKAASLCASIDLAHALHPNYIAKHEPRHQLQLGGGIVIKSNAQQRYASDAISTALISLVCKQHQIPTQYFVTKSDMPCGSTVGPINATRSGIKSVDIGCAQLSMHSSRELISCQDHLFMCQLLTGLLSQPIPSF